MEFAVTTVADGLAFPECPRWHDGALWFSDQHDRRVCRLGPGGEVETVIDVPGHPSGLGWRPDGSLLVVSMEDRRVLRVAEGETTTVAELDAVTGGPCNDMVVDTAGRAYVGNFGFDLYTPAPVVDTTGLVRIDPDGSVAVVAADLAFPNGAVISPDGQTLVVAETFASRLSAFDVGRDGSLSGRRVFAEVPGSVPDGICLDAEGAVWFADPVARRCVRVADGGPILEEVPTEQGCYACMLGGPDRRTLFLMTAGSSVPEQAVELRSGRVEAVEVGVPGAGLP